MTNDEALRLIKATEYCYVIWSEAQNEVIAVRPVRKGASGDEQQAVLATLWREDEGPTMARFLESALQKVQADIARLAERSRTLYAWRA